MGTNARMYSDGCCPYCGHTVDGTICATVKRSSEVKVAWTITKLKLVRTLLKPLMKWHIKHINKKKDENYDRRHGRRGGGAP
jgi:DNA-binding HxlR family transcriptional regulator